MRALPDLLRRLLFRRSTMFGLFLAVLAVLYLFEGVPADMPFVAMVIATIAALAFLLSGKLPFSVYAGMATVVLVTLVSTVKYRMKGFDLHVFDFGFTGADGAAVSFLLSGYGRLILPVVLLILLAAACLVVFARLDRRRRYGWRPRLVALPAFVAGLYVTYPLSAETPRYFHYLGGYNASAFFVSALDLEYLFARSEFADRLKAVPPQPAFDTAIDCGDPSALPDVFVVLSESQTDPAYFPQIKAGAAFGDSFRSDDGKARPLVVETYGGGTWISNLSMMTGLSSTDFGVQAPYLTTVLDGRVGGALPAMLAGCGYRTAALLPMKRSFVNEGPFLESIGIQEIFDFDAIGAREYAHRDAFYFEAAERIVREHRATDRRPLFLAMQTMFPHSPYDKPLAAANGAPPVASGIDAETDEYLGRMLASRQDFAAYLAAVRKLSTARGTVVLEYGDHQSVATKGLSDALAGGNAVADLRSVAYRTYYTLHAFGYRLDMDALPKGELDIAFLGPSLVQAARLPRSALYAELIDLSRRCGGRFHACADRQAVDRHLRRRADSGLLDVF